MSSNSAASFSSLHASLHALTPLTPASTSSLSSSSSTSEVSRQSSCRSTASVQAVPFRKPVRGRVASAGMQRNGSGGVGRGFDSTGPGAMTPSLSDEGYFPPEVQVRSPSSDPNDGPTELLIQPVNGSGTSTSSNGLGVPSSAMESSLTDWSAVGEAVNSHPNANGSNAAVRNGVERPRSAGDSLLTVGGTPTRPGTARQGSNASLIVLRKTVSDFQFGDVLGEGSYSTVTLVTDKYPPHKQYALKVLDKEHIKREKKTKYVLIERDTLKTLDGHPGIVRLYWTFQDQRSLYYVLELAKNGELLKWIKKFGSFSLPSARFYAGQILSAVEHMHKNGVIHRDLKPENILLDDKMRIKVTDFGTAKLLEELPTGDDDPPKARTRSFVGTPEYVSPEILSEGKESSKSSDYWGFGCILFQILAGRPPFQARTEYLMFQKIIKLEYEFPESFPADARDLVEKLLVLDPTERLGGSEEGIEAIKRHPFFTADPAIDFATIWKVEPPPIETGLTLPKPEVYGEFVVPEGLDTFGDDSDVEDQSDPEGNPAFDRRRNDETESPSSMGRGGAAAELAALVNGNGNGLHSRRGSSVIKGPAEPVTKWTGVLLPRELILFASPILDRGGFINKQRTLILTDYPRLICIKETATKVTLKSEVFLGVKAPPKPGTSTFIKADAENDRVFTVRTNLRTNKYEEPGGSAVRWVAELRDAHAKGLLPPPS